MDWFQLCPLAYSDTSDFLCRLISKLIAFLLMQFFVSFASLSHITRINRLFHVNIYIFAGLISLVLPSSRSALSSASISIWAKSLLLRAPTTFSLSLRYNYHYSPQSFPATYATAVKYLRRIQKCSWYLRLICHLCSRSYSFLYHVSLITHMQSHHLLISRRALCPERVCWDYRAPSYPVHARLD